MLASPALLRLSGEAQVEQSAAWQSGGFEVQDLGSQIVSLASGAAPPERFGLKFVGSEGTMEVTMGGVTLDRKPREAEPGMTLDNFDKADTLSFLWEGTGRTKGQAAIAGILADLVFWPTPDGRPHFYEMD